MPKVSLSLAAVCVNHAYAVYFFKGGYCECYHVCPHQRSVVFVLHAGKSKQIIKGGFLMD